VSALAHRYPTWASFMSHDQTSDGQPTRLKVLLQERHLQEHRAFNREYDRVAGAIDRSLVGGGPSKATFYRWLSGNLQTLPYPVHCQVLEKMLPGWAARDLFAAADGQQAASSTTSRAEAVDDGLAGVTAVFVTRSEFAHAIPPHRLFDEANSVDAAGLSLNVLCQQYPDRSLRALLARARLRLLFLDPDGDSIKRRTAEEKPRARPSRALDACQHQRHPTGSRRAWWRCRRARTDPAVRRNHPLQPHAD
jgi:hypothetical protein